MKRAGSYRPMTPAQMQEFHANLQDKYGYCYFADPEHRIEHRCTGRSWGMHLYPQSQLKRDFREGAWKMPDGQFWRPLTRQTPNRKGMVTLTLGEICSDTRFGVPGCDGIHAPFDNNIDLRREAFPILPPDFMRVVRAYQLEAAVELYYGLKPYSLEAR